MLRIASGAHLPSHWPLTCGEFDSINPGHRVTMTPSFHSLPSPGFPRYPFIDQRMDEKLGWL